MLTDVIPIASLPSGPILLRPYQQAAVTATMEGFKDYRRQLLVCPTGGGKTLIFAELAEAFQPGRTLVLAHREELLEQARDKILRASGITAEIEAAERKASLQAPVVIASVQTLSRMSRRTRFPVDHFKLVVVDEGHHVLAESYQRVLAHFESDGTKVLGVTATPDRGDKRLLADYFENIPHETTLIDLIQGGYLSRIHVKTIPLKIDLRGVHVVAGDFNAGELGHALEAHLGAIADVVARDYPDRKSLVFLPLCALSERFALLCRERGIAAEHVDGTSQDRGGVLERFRAGETTLVSNAMLWTEGFDEPSIDCVIPLRPTKIRSLYAQQLGRGTRIHPGKDHLLVLDFLWLTHRHNLIRPASLVAADAGEASQINHDGDLLEAVNRFRRKKLLALERELEANKARQAAEFDLLEFAVAIGDEALVEFEPTMRWHEDPLSSKQRDLLARCGVNPAGIQTKGHAAALITRLSERRHMGLATFKQVRLMRKLGIPNPHLISFQRAGEIIDRHFAPKARKENSLCTP